MVKPLIFINHLMKILVIDEWENIYTKVKATLTSPVYWASGVPLK